MAVVDVASLGVTVEAQGVDATRAALEGIEALGQRVGRTVGQITLRLSGTDVVAQQARSVGESVSRTLGAAVPPIAVRFTTPGADNALAIVQGARREAEALAAGLGVEAAAARVAASAEAELARARQQAASAPPVARPPVGASPAPRDHNVVGHIPGLDDLGRESADAAAAQQTLAKDARAAADALSAEERRIAAIVASVEDMATSIDVASGRQVASFRANARAAGEYLETIHAGEQAAERIADAMLNVTTRAAQAAAAPRLPPPSASPSSRPVDDEGGTAAIQRRVAMLEQATRIESTRSEALTRLGGVEAGLARALERTNLTLQQRVTLEQLLARTQTAGRSAPPPAAFGTADTGALSRRIALLTQGTQVDATFAESVTKLTGVQGGLEAALKGSNLTLEQRIALGGQLARVEAVLAGAAGGATAGVEKSGTAATVAGSKFRSAANGLTAMAFAATAGGGSMQGLALAAGLAASSLAEIGGKAAATAGIVGAGITVFAGFIGVLEQLRQKRQQLALQTVVDPRFTRSAADAQTSVGQLDRQIGLLQDKLRDLNGISAALPGGFGIEGAFFGQANAIRQRLADVQALRAELVKQRAVPLAAEEAEQRRQATIGGLQAENAAVAAAVDARLATERGAYEQGRSDLASYFASRVAAVRSAAAREVDEMRAQQRALRDDTGRPADETRAARDSRLAEASQIDAQIRAVRSRAAGEEAAARAERASAERALAARLVGYEAEVATARGDAHGAALLQIGQRVEAFQQAMAQEGRLTAEQQKAAARFYGDTLTRQAQAAEAQRVLAREQSALGAKRAEIQARVNAGTVTELQGAQEIAAAERERMPTLNAQLAIIERIALALNNPDLLAFVRQTRAELEGLGTALTPLQERMKAVFNDLAARATAMTDAVRAKIDELVSKAGGVVTPKIAVQAEWMTTMASSITKQWAMMGVNAGAVFIDSIRAGIEGFGEGPITFGSFFKTFGNTLLQGLGGVMADMGAQLLLLGGVMTGLLPFFSNPITAGPAMLIAGGILLTAGATLGAIATRNRGGGGGGGGGSVSAPANFDQSASVILTPRAAGKAPAPQPIVQIGSVQILNPNDPSWQRQLSESVQGGVRRGLKFGMAGT